MNLRPAGWLVLALALVGVLFWYAQPSALPVETALVTVGRFSAIVEEDGVTKVRNRYLIGAPLSGHLSRITLRPGDTIEEGAVVAIIRPSPAPFLDPRSKREAEARLGQTEAAHESALQVVEQARARRDHAKRELDRYTQLAGRGSATAQQLEQAKLAFDLAERELTAALSAERAALHDVEQARAVLARYDAAGGEQLEVWRVTSPVSGTVLRVLQESETSVAPGQTLLEAADLRDLEIQADVVTADAVQISPGAEVFVTGWGGNTLKARVRRVEPAAFTKVSALGVEEQRVNVIIDLTSPREDWAAIGDGFRIVARIEVFALEDSLLVPSGALYASDGKWFVYVVDDGRAAEREVVLVRRSGDVAAVSSGVRAGDAVILYPGNALSPGARVSPLP